MTQEALKLALEALEFIPESGSMLGAHAEAKRLEAITAIKETLAQLEQEPVAWIYKGEKSFDGNKYIDEYELTASKQVAFWKDKNAEPLYTTPPKRKPLTDEQIFDLSEPFGAFQYGDAQGHKRLEFARAIEAKLKGKNGG